MTLGALLARTALFCGTVGLTLLVLVYLGDNGIRRQPLVIRTVQVALGLWAVLCVMVGVWIW